MGVERLIFNHAQHGQVVGEAARGRNHFHVIGLEGSDALRSLDEAVGAAGAAEVVGADQESGSGGAEGGAKPGQLGPGSLFSRFDFEIDDMAAGLGGLKEQIQLRIQRPNEVATKGLAAAGGNYRQLAMTMEEGLEGRGYCCRLGQGIEP